MVTDPEVRHGQEEYVPSREARNKAAKLCKPSKGFAFISFDWSITVGWAPVNEPPLWQPRQ